MADTPTIREIHRTLQKAASLIRSARCLIAFTASDIYVESVIPPFQGAGSRNSTGEAFHRPSCALSDRIRADNRQGQS